MIKVFFKKLSGTQGCDLTVYSSLNPVPFSLAFRKDSIPTTIYARNLYGENFIEFRFDNNSKQLYEITLVAIQNNTVDIVDYSLLDNTLFRETFECLIMEDSRFEVSLPIKIYRNNNSISIVWDNTVLDYYRVSEKCIVGVNSCQCLSSITLVDLRGEEIIDIFGF
jgi:hypothetical protein